MIKNILYEKLSLTFESASKVFSHSFMYGQKINFVENLTKSGW